MTAWYCPACKGHFRSSLEFALHFCGRCHVPAPKQGPDSPTNGRVSGASGCSGPRSGAEPQHSRGAAPAPSVDGVVGGKDQA